MRRAVVSLLVALSLLTPCLAAPEVAAPSCLLMDRATGTVLYEKDADRRLAPASVTKIMTLLLVMEAIDSGQLTWDETVMASANAAGKGGSQVYLAENEHMTVRDMVKCVVVASANDCAAALAERVAGSESAFVDRMNDKAAELGMVNTHFENCTGLDDEAPADRHYTTSRDIAIMSRALLAHDGIREFTTIWMDTIRNGTFGLTNTNKLVRFYPDATGLKTGFTQAAGYCMSATAERDGMELIAAVMHCGSSTERFNSARELLEYGFANYTLVDPAADVVLEPVTVELGTAETVQAVPRDSEPVLLEKTAAAGCEREISLPSQVEVPVEAGQVLGTLTLRQGDTILAEVPLVAETGVERLGFGARMVRFLRYLWMAE